MACRTKARSTLGSSGAPVLGIAFSEAEGHKKLLAVGLPGIHVFENDRDQLTGKQQREVRSRVDRQLALGQGSGGGPGSRSGCPARRRSPADRSPSGVGQ